MLGMRPEHLHIGPPDGSLGIPATVRVVESLGHERLVLCRVAGADGDIVVRTSGECAPPRSGEGIRLKCAPTDLHLFDPISTARIDP